MAMQRQTLAKKLLPRIALRADLRLAIGDAPRKVCVQQSGILAHVRTPYETAPNWGTMVAGWRRGRGLRPGGCTRGFVIPTSMDQRALDSLCFVLARFGVQAEEDEKARILGPAVSLRTAAGARVLPASTRGALRAIGRPFRSCKRCRGVDRCGAHRRWRGDRDLGALASWYELEWSRDPQRGT